jgi:hypothetical protein
MKPELKAKLQRGIKACPYVIPVVAMLLFRFIILPIFQERES